MEYVGKGGRYSLEEKPMKQGGEGAIHTINGRNDIVAKVYFKERVTTELADKLTFMANNPPDSSILSQIAWPQDVLRDVSGNFVGFVMPKLKIDADLKDIYVYPPKKDLQITYEQKIIIAINICIVISAIHKAGYIFGDFNPLNIGVNLTTGHVAFLDTDSYHIYDRYNRKMYRCGVCLDGYVAPELIQQCKGTDYLSAPLPTFTQETDKFALAIHIFKLLMNGYTPFNGIKETETVSQASPGRGNKAIENDNYCFKAGNKPQSVATPDLSAFPPEIQSLFKRAFTDGRENPEIRPSADEWYCALCDYKKNLVQCKKDTSHFYHINDKECPYCGADNRYNNSLGRASSGNQMTFNQPISVPVTSLNSYSSGRGPYMPTSKSSPITIGSGSPSYVGSSKNQFYSSYSKKGGFTKKVVNWTVALSIALTIMGALFGFVVWPKMIYPNMSNDDFNTPEIVQSYYGRMDRDSSRYNEEIYNYIFTITSCDESGNLQATCELVHEKDYGKYILTGKITEKKNNGNVKIGFIASQWEFQTKSETWFDHLDVEITNHFTKFSSKEINLYSGTNDKFEIKTAADLRKLYGSNEFYILKNDIDLSGTNWTPIDGFTGVLIGNGYSIKNLQIESATSNVGFFSTLDGTVMNLNFENATVVVDGRTENVGALCGTLNGTALKVNVSGSVIAEKSNNVGGIAGNVETQGTFSIANLSSKTSVTGLSYVGGVFGRINNDISNGCNSYVVSVKNLVNEGAVTARKDYAAGIIGHFYTNTTGFGGSVVANITDCTNIGSITGNCYVGGIIGYGECDTDSTIENCKNRSVINANAYVGCIAGATGRFCIIGSDNEGSTLQANGYVIVDGEKYAYVGGLVGKGTCLENCTNYIDIKYNADGKFVGGLMGYCNLGEAIRGVSLASDTASANIKNLVNNGNVEGNSYVGGIMGGLMYYWDNGCNNVTATFEKMTNTGTILANGNYAGGLSGYMAGDVGGVGGGLDWCIYDSKNSGNISGGENVGGLFGGFKNGAESGSAYASNTVLIEGCISTGKLFGSQNCNDIIGLDSIIE